MKQNDLSKEATAHPLDDYFKSFDQEMTSQSQVQALETSSELDKHLSEQDRQKIHSLSAQIEPLNHESLLKFGANAQTQLSTFSHQMLNEIQSKDVGPIGDTLEQLMKKLKEVDPESLSQKDDSFLKKIFKRSKNSMQQLFSRMQSVSAQVDRISIELDKNKSLLVKDIQMLDGLYQQNKDYFDILNLYIQAGEQKKKEIEQALLPQLREEAKSASDQMKVQEVADMEQFFRSFR
ncbi:tellurite resistance protein [Staphylococcus schleiferi]|uniref:Tellurite resistance protein n=1 Tax=Staphylococcus schleiferi TaxID=1295 RepID=A0A7Z7VXD2_STASC|nr:toxic anion resistance protein [Staphylococcus schleiferi]CAD7359786.1 tellurite resistance protein [Staphylococcus schleiferi]SUM88961.1 tellurite resistance protein [Staphylococcus schleiferi]